MKAAPALKQGEDQGSQLQWQHHSHRCRGSEPARCAAMHRACTVAAAQLSLQGNPPLRGKVAKQPGRDVATGTGDILSLLQALVPRADSSSGNAAKQTSSEPHSAAPAGPAQLLPGQPWPQTKDESLAGTSCWSQEEGKKKTDLVLLSLH